MKWRATAGALLDDIPHIVIENRCDPAILDRIIRHAEPLLDSTATSIAGDYSVDVPDLVQEGRITLWQIDVTRFSQRDVRYLVRVIYTRMVDAYRTECRRGLTTGWSKHRTRRRVRKL